LLGGDAVRLVAARASANGEANQNLLALLDADGDGRFSRTELDRAVERVSKYDYARDGTVRDLDLVQASRRDRAQTTSLGTVLGPSHGAQDAVRLLHEHYADAEGRIPRNAFQIAPDLFDRLDADRDGQLRDAELARIGSLPPQIVLSSDLPEAEDSNAILELKGTSPGLVANHTAGPHEAMFHRWQCGASRLDIHTLSGTATGRPALRVRGLFQAYDRNGNGYLERTEANDSEGSRFRPDQFDGWDADGDGQIFPKELAAAFEREAALTRCWFQIALTRHPPSLWSLLDRNRDGTLSEREMHSIRPTLAEFDADGDGEIAYHELPFHFVMQLARGDRELNETSTVPSPPLASFKPKPGPKWFHKMDANRDGDLSQREFLGTREQFERIDADRDGLIDGKEAEAATP
ncbi:MAG TPA: hypothetical protein VHB77_14630, partial [Planctomycetaceae bacterium]|nr:hypothetical protein [Planctomycetaceae bacterium]